MVAPKPDPIPLSAAVARAAEKPRHASVHGACACGTVRFAARIDPATAAPCICARCRGMGLTLASADDAAFRLLTGAEELTEPLSDARTPHHFFCGRCGEPVFGRPGDGRVTVSMACVARGAPDDLIDG